MNPDHDQMDKEARTWRVVYTDNLARESVAEKVIVDGINYSQAERITEILREDCPSSGTAWFVVRHRIERIWGGLAELV